MNEEIVQNIDLAETKSSKTSFGFLFSNFVFGVLLILVTQIIRLLVLYFNQKVFLNEKFAFSINFPTALIYFLYLIVFFLVIIYLSRHWVTLSSNSHIGFILILSGGIANLLERIIFNHVVDYFFILNGVLNLADFYIFLGAALVIFSKKNSVKLE